MCVTAPELGLSPPSHILASTAPVFITESNKHLEGIIILRHTEAGDSCSFSKLVKELERERGG